MASTNFTLDSFGDADEQICHAEGEGLYDDLVAQLEAYDKIKAASAVEHPKDLTPVFPDRDTWLNNYIELINSASETRTQFRDEMKRSLTDDFQVKKDALDMVAHGMLDGAKWDAEEFDKSEPKTCMDQMKKSPLVR